MSKDVKDRRAKRQRNLRLAPVVALVAALFASGVVAGPSAFAEQDVVTPSASPTAAGSPTVTPAPEPSQLSASATPNVAGAETSSPTAAEPSKTVAPQEPTTKAAEPEASPSSSLSSPTQAANKSAATALAAATGSCDPAALYYLTSYASNGYPALMKYANGASTSVKNLSGLSTIPDALGVSTSGYAYFIDGVALAQGSSPRIYRVDLGNGTQTQYSGAALLQGVLQNVNGAPAGAVSPANGHYYYAIPTNLGNSTWDLYAFNTETNSAIGFVGRIAASSSNGAGDIAFDPEGNLYLSIHNNYNNQTNGTIYQVAASAIPTTAQQASKTLPSTSAGRQNETLYPTGLAFMSQETSRPLWSASYGSGSVNKRTPGQNDAVAGVNLGNSYIQDLASCASPSAVIPRLSLVKEVVGRAVSSDQFAISIRNNSGTVLGSATTTGTSAGLQGEVVGPLEVTPGSTYQLRETGSGGTDLGKYSSELVCRDDATGDEIVTNSGSAGYSLTYPSTGTTRVTCTLTNIPPASISVTKLLPGGRFAASDQFTLEVRKGDSSGPVLDVPGDPTTQGQGTTVQANTGTTGRFEVAAGERLTLTERAEAGVDLSKYTPSISCSDSTGRQKNLPNGTALDIEGGYSITPEPGAKLTCTISNATTGAGIGIGEGLTCRAGYVYAIASTYPGSSARSYSRVYEIDTSTGRQVGSGNELPNEGNDQQFSGNLNSLAVSQGGLFSYYSSQRLGTAGEARALPIFQQDNKTGTTKLLDTFQVPTGVPTGLVRGGINPADGVYWISSSGTVSGQERHHFWAYNTLTGTNYGYVGYLTGPVGSNGDLVFDQDGNMLLVTSTSSSGQLWRVEGLTSALAGAPRSTATAIDSLISKARLTSLATSGQFNGVTFDNDGYLYVSYSGGADTSFLQKLDPNTGRPVGNPLQITGLGSAGGVARVVTDLADCNDPGGIRLQKDYRGRVAASDNVNLEIRKVGIDAPLLGGSATTDGPETGVQRKSSSVIIGVPGGTYVLTESAASGKLTDYSSTMTCVDKTHGDANVAVRKVSQGRYELDFPGVGPGDGELLANVVCTYVNTPNGTLELNKELRGARAQEGDQFRIRIRAGNTDAAVATTTGSGAAIENGRTSIVRAQSGVTRYTFDELGWRSGQQNDQVLDSYPNATITCVDRNGRQPTADLPSGSLLADFAGLSPVVGADISCTITNTAKPPLDVQCSPGYVYSINDDGSLEEVFVDPATGNATITAATGWRGQGTAFNGLGINADGSRAYTYQIERVGAGLEGRDRIRVFSSTDGEFASAPSDWFSPEVGSWFYFITGAVNPANGHYVFGGYNFDATVGDLVFRAFDYDPDTSEFRSLGYFTTGHGEFLRTNSDIAFDSVGNLYVLESLPDSVGTPVRIHSIQADVLATANGGSLAASATKPFPIEKSNSEGVVGLAFDATGAAYLSTKTVLYTFNPTTWEQLAEPRPILSNSADLASCNSPSTLTVQKDVVSRLAQTDQFELSASQAEQVFANAVTAGQQPGLQDQQIGPVPVYSDGTTKYSFGEQMAAGATSALSKYQSSWACTDATGKELASGTGTMGEVVLSSVSSAVTCVITNDPLLSIRVEKLGQNCDVGQPTCALPGAEFALYDVDPTTAGAEPIVDALAMDRLDPSRFDSIGLKVPGTFWLVETKAPAGFELLATPVKFSLSGAGIVLADASQVVTIKSTDAFTIQVLDSTAAPLPKSGGDGPWLFLGLGLLLLLGSVVLLKAPGSRRSFAGLPN